jgi:hypothetical protein
VTSDLSNPFLSISQICASGQHIEYFEQLQASCKLPAPFKKLEVHNNTRWGTAYGMVKCASELHQVLLHFFTRFLGQKLIDSYCSQSAFSSQLQMICLAQSPPFAQTGRSRKRYLGQPSGYLNVIGLVLKTLNVF